ncbi:MAG TPA: PA2169 family four-helix-bundle protein [Terriglobia bacterium]|nr:PA2169 family four-helix-bundle protein [Terriglobia bacterium]
MAVNRDELIQCLNDLIQTCRDGESGFQTAADHVKDTELKRLFGECSIQRAQFASELESEVRQLGGTPSRFGSVSAAFHRGWMNIKSIVTGGNDDAIIAECERGEDAAVENYQRILKQNLPPNVLPVAKHQFTQIKRSHDWIRELKQKAA